MHALVTNDSSDVGALEGAMVYEACRVENVGSEEARLDCVVDKAFANLGAMMASRVEGAVSVEVVEIAASPSTPTPSSPRRDASTTCSASSASMRTACC